MHIDIDMHIPAETGWSVSDARRHNVISCGNRSVKVVETILIYVPLQNLPDRSLLSQSIPQNTIAMKIIYALLVFLVMQCLSANFLRHEI